MWICLEGEDGWRRAIWSVAVSGRELGTWSQTAVFRRRSRCTREHRGEMLVKQQEIL